jgi:hypothetical protein
VLLLAMTRSAPETFAWVGAVPAAGALQNDLVQSAANMIVVPLDQSGQFTMTADGLAGEIGGVTRVARWSAATQGWTVRIVGVSGLNFPVRTGYPYGVRTNDTAPLVWP